VLLGPHRADQADDRGPSSGRFQRRRCEPPRDVDEGRHRTRDAIGVVTAMSLLMRVADVSRIMIERAFPQVMMVEAKSFNPCVTGSNPVRPTCGNRSSSQKAVIGPLASRGERRRFAALRDAGGASSRDVPCRRRVAPTKWTCSRDRVARSLEPHADFTGQPVTFDKTIAGGVTVGDPPAEPAHRMNLGAPL
jgi:hypothetical protein